MNEDKCFQVPPSKSGFVREENVGDAACRRQSRCLVKQDIFIVEAVVNYQNDRVYATLSRRIPKGARTYLKWQKTTGVIVWAVFAYNGSKSPLMFNEVLKMNNSLPANVGERSLAMVVSHIWKSLFLHSRWSSSKHSQFGAELVLVIFLWIFWQV